ncbi:MAG TPA: phosphoribosylformylglycinamidine synthase subunit PurQ, partial [Gammaproteobacteria bacterium]|nr:phosphoribosylformylglycinamidine synthase subunit PurQ [Gammaproteobacteria bacterium]
DRSDGGWLATLTEMAFAAHCGLAIMLPEDVTDIAAWLFNEEPGAALQVRAEHAGEVFAVLERHGITDVAVVARPVSDSRISVSHKGTTLLDEKCVVMRRYWSELSYRMQTLRDDPECASEAFVATLGADDPGLHAHLTFDLPAEPQARSFADRRPAVAVLREQGVNGQREMAAALDAAGFAAHDVHMTDIIEGRVSLERFRGLVACGGFSYGDVLGAGEGWAKSILYRDALREQFAAFFAREDAFALGVCNGCQMLAALRQLIPGAQSWPRFVRNRSDQFEARLSLVEVQHSPSVLLRGMEGSRIPVVVSHGEGRARFDDAAQLSACSEQLTTLRFVDHHARRSDTYPFNPNGSPEGITGLCNTDGRVTIMMPHPERVFRTAQFSWHPPQWEFFSPWMRLFDNARSFID